MTLDPASLQPESAVRQRIIGWLNENYHFGEAERLIESDAASLTRTGVLDRAVLRDLLVHLGEVFQIAIDRRAPPLPGRRTLPRSGSFLLSPPPPPPAPPLQGPTPPPTPAPHGRTC